jgi:hypothetical protein
MKRLFVFVFILMFSFCNQQKDNQPAKVDAPVFKILFDTPGLKSEPVLLCKPVVYVIAAFAEVLALNAYFKPP